MKNLSLRRLIYGMKNTIVLEGATPEAMVNEIEAVRSSVAIEGFIFRPSFANTTELTDYTTEDWDAMLAQYSLTYGWADRYMGMTGIRPEEVLDGYFADINNVFTPEAIAKKAFFTEGTTYYRTMLQEIADSKIVLRTHQIEILNLMPIELIKSVYDATKFTIKETQILFMKRLVLETGTAVKFSSPTEIVRFVIAVFPKNTESYTGQVTNNILAGIDVKIPTSARKKIVRAIEKMDHTHATMDMKKHKQFWKRLFKQLAWQSEAKMVESLHFQNYLDIKGTLYNETIETPNSYIAAARKAGDLEAAFYKEYENPGQLVRNLLSYLRYPTGTSFAHRQGAIHAETGISKYFEERGVTGTVAITDISTNLSSQEFMDAMMQVNPKLLWQVLTMLKDPKWYKALDKRKVYKAQTVYTTPLPALDPAMTETAIAVLTKAIKKIKKASNSGLGKVFIDKSLKNYSMQFSGRSETSISLSGEYLSPGSKIDLTELLADGNKIIRMGIAWRGDYSCDIDHSLSIAGHRNIYYGRPTLLSDKSTNLSRILIASSGDITTCSNTRFSTEIIDIDVAALKKCSNITKMINSAIMYSGKTFDTVECYWFMNVIDRSERVISGNPVFMELDAMHYAIQLQEPTKAQLGFTIDLEKNELEVINIPQTTKNSGHNADTLDKYFETIIGDRPKYTSLYKGLKSVIRKSQFVDSIDEADLIISADPLMPQDKTLHPGRDMVKLQEIIF